MGTEAFIDYFIVGAIGFAVGLGELVARYRDAPLRSVRSLPASLYIFINVLAATGALLLIRTFEWNFGYDAGDELRVIQVLVAGTASMALFRSALFTVRVGDQDIGVGPSSFLQVILDAADRGVDRIRAEARVQEVMSAMNGVSFDRANEALPALCLTLMQNLTTEEQAALGEEIGELAASEIPENVKSLILGLKLMNLTGQGVLLGAVDAVKEQIQQVSRIEFDEDVVRCEVGEPMQLRPRLTGEAGAELSTSILSWRSHNEAVATVNGRGEVVPHGPGRAWISASVDGKTAGILAVVHEPDAAPTSA